MTVCIENLSCDNIDCSKYEHCRIRCNDPYDNYEKCEFFKDGSCCVSVLKTKKE